MIGLPTSYVSQYTMNDASDGNRHTQPDALSQRGFGTAQMIQRPESSSCMAGAVSKQPPS